MVSYYPDWSSAVARKHDDSLPRTRIIRTSTSSLWRLVWGHKGRRSSGSPTLFCGPLILNKLFQKLFSNFKKLHTANWLVGLPFITSSFLPIKSGLALAPWLDTLVSPYCDLRLFRCRIRTAVAAFFFWHDDPCGGAMSGFCYEEKSRVCWQSERGRQGTDLG